MSHRSICATCEEPYTCPGFPIDNADGWPEVACSVCDVRGERECGECLDADRCKACGLPIEIGDHKPCEAELAVD